MHSRTRKVSVWLLGSLWFLIPQVAWGQVAAPRQPIDPQPVEADSEPEEAVESPLLESLEALSEESPEPMPELWEQPWDLTALPDGMHLVSTDTDPDAEKALFAFFEKQEDQVIGYRYYPEQASANGVLNCFRGQVAPEDEKKQTTDQEPQNQVTEALSAAYVDSEGWYFHGSDVVFGQFPYRLEVLPANLSDEAVAAEIEICRQVLAGIETVPEEQLLLGVFSYLPLASDRTLIDGSYYNFHEFRGQAGQAVEILMTSDAIDPYLILLDADEQEIATDDDSGGRQNALIRMTLPRTGTYRIIANTYVFASEGEYLLTVTVD